MSVHIRLQGLINREVQCHSDFYLYNTVENVSSIKNIYFINFISDKEYGVKNLFISTSPFRSIDYKFNNRFSFLHLISKEYSGISIISWDT